MSQKLSGADVIEVGATRGFENVGENWNYYDTVLVGAYANNMQFHDGWFSTFAAVGGAVNLPFFNVRNRNHGLAYNNQDTRDQTAFAYRIFTIGVSFFAPSCPLYQTAVGGPVGPEVTQTQLWELELPKHASLTLQVQQDERLAIASLMTPPGYGAIGGGVSQGDPEAAWTGAPPNTSLWNFTQGTPELTNKWGFRNPIEVPRRANISVNIQFSEYGRNLLQDLAGPNSYSFWSGGSLPGNWLYKPAFFGIQVSLGGQRLVQQRGQYHA